MGIWLIIYIAGYIVTLWVTYKRMKSEKGDGVHKAMEAITSNKILASLILALIMLIINSIWFIIIITMTLKDCKGD